MLCKRTENIFQRPRNRTIEASLADWCGLSTPNEPTISRKKQQKPQRQKISIKTFKSEMKSQDLQRASLGLPSSTGLVSAERQSANSYVHNKMAPKLHFTYAVNQKPITGLPSPVCFTAPHEPTGRYSTAVRLFCPRLESQPIKVETGHIPLGKQGPFAAEDEELAKTIKISHAYATNQQPRLDPYEMLPTPNLVKVVTNATTDASHHRQKSQALPKTEKNCGEWGEKPRARNFQRGTLFKAVRKSQTINTDVKSQSSSSIVIEDYKSLMSKIQENKLQEEFQEFQEI